MASQAFPILSQGKPMNSCVLFSLQTLAYMISFTLINYTTRMLLTCRFICSALISPLGSRFLYPTANCLYPGPQTPPLQPSSWPSPRTTLKCVPSVILILASDPTQARNLSYILDTSFSLIRTKSC